jgi:hypothetical protein
MSWAMLRMARIAHLLGWADAGRAAAFIGAIPSAVCKARNGGNDSKWRLFLNFRSERSTKNGDAATA